MMNKKKEMKEMKKMKKMKEMKAGQAGLLWRQCSFKVLSLSTGLGL